MTLPSKPGEKPKFSDSEEEIYFLKQVGRFTRSVSGNEGHGINIYLCKMKPDGSAKTELKELWRDVRYPIDTQAQSCWMDVNAKTKKIALSVTYAGSDLTGLWTMNLDGNDLKRIITPERKQKSFQAIDSPSWTPDGQWIVFGESWRGEERGQIAKCDSQGKHFVYLTAGPADGQPRVSPDGEQVLYVHNPMKKLGSDGAGERWVAATLWIVDLKGSDNVEIPNPKARPDWPAKGQSGTYPAWSPDGKSILLIAGDSEIIDVASGRVIVDHRPMLQGDPHKGTCGWCQWGRGGFVGFTVGGILFTDSELREARWIGSSKLVECSGNRDSCRW